MTYDHLWWGCHIEVREGAQSKHSQSFLVFCGNFLTVGAGVDPFPRDVSGKSSRSSRYTPCYGAGLASPYLFGMLSMDISYTCIINWINCEFHIVTACYYIFLLNYPSSLLFVQVSGSFSIEPFGIPMVKPQTDCKNNPSMIRTVKVSLALPHSMIQYPQILLVKST